MPPCLPFMRLLPLIAICSGRVQGMYTGFENFMKFILNFIFHEIYEIYEICWKFQKFMKFMKNKESKDSYFRPKPGQSQSTNDTILRSAHTQQEVERRSEISPLRHSVATLLLQEKPASRFQLCSPEWTLRETVSPITGLSVCRAKWVTNF